MKLKTLASALLVTLMISSCDDSTGTIGTSITSDMDKLEIKTDSFNVTTKSIAAGNVLSRNINGYLGKFKDPETGSYITADFMTQFGVLEDFNLPNEGDIVSKDNGKVIADSCEIRLYYDDVVGDSTALMHLKMYELSKPVTDAAALYTNSNAIESNYLRSGGFEVEKAYTLADLTTDAKEKAEKNYSPSIKISMNKPYTDKDGVTYKNYGTYLLQKYYSKPSDFSNSYTLINNVIPGFYFKSVGGSGSIGRVFNTIMFVYFRIQYNGKVYNRIASFSGTQEVLQATHIVNDQQAIQQLINQNSGTYLKTPAGIFTEMTQRLRYNESTTFRQALMHCKRQSRY